MSSTSTTSGNGFTSVEDLQDAVHRLEAKVAQLNRALGSGGHTGLNPVPDNWDPRRTVDVRPGQAAEFTIAEVVDPAVAGAALRNAKREATTDVVTGLMDRRGLRSYLTSFARRQAQTGKEAARLSVVSVDLVGFKRFNDDYSYESGTHIIQVFGAAVNDAITSLGMDKAEKGSFRIARTGGDEFHIIGQQPLAQVDRKQLFGAIQQAFEQRFDGLILDPPSDLVLKNKVRPDTELDQEAFAFRFGYTTIKYEANSLVSGEILALVEQQFKASNLMMATTKAILPDRREGRDLQDGSEERRLPVEGKPAAGTVMLRGDETNLRDVRSPRAWDEVLVDVNEPVEALEITEPLARSARDSSISR